MTSYYKKGSNKVLASVLTIGLMLCCLIHSTAQDAKSIVNVKLDNGKFLSVQACSDKIFRVRVSSNAEFPQSLMERYEILKTDWSAVKTTSKKEKNTTIVQTDGYQISVNNETGDLSVKDSKGLIVLDKMHIYYQDKQPVSDNLLQSFLKFFSTIKHGGGIIGDSNYAGSVKDSTKNSVYLAPSLLEIPLAEGERFYGGGATSRKNIHRKAISPAQMGVWACFWRTYHGRSVWANERCHTI